MASVVSARAPEDPEPPHTPNSSTIPLQHRPPASSTPAQQPPVKSTAVALPPHVPHASRAELQQPPRASRLEPWGQHVPFWLTTPACAPLCDYTAWPDRDSRQSEGRHKVLQEDRRMFDCATALCPQEHRTGRCGGGFGSRSSSIFERLFRGQSHVHASPSACMGHAKWQTS